MDNFLKDAERSDMNSSDVDTLKEMIEERISAISEKYTSQYTDAEGEIFDQIMSSFADSITTKIVKYEDSYIENEFLIVEYIEKLLDNSMQSALEAPIVVDQAEVSVATDGYDDVEVVSDSSSRSSSPDGDSLLAGIVAQAEKLRSASASQEPKKPEGPEDQLKYLQNNAGVNITQSKDAEAALQTIGIKMKNTEAKAFFDRTQIVFDDGFGEGKATITQAYELAAGKNLGNVRLGDYEITTDEFPQAFFEALKEFYKDLEKPTKAVSAESKTSAANEAGTNSVQQQDSSVDRTEAKQPTRRSSGDIANMTPEELGGVGVDEIAMAMSNMENEENSSKAKSSKPALPEKPQNLSTKATKPPLARKSTFAKNAARHDREKVGEKPSSEPNQPSFRNLKAMFEKGVPGGRE